MLWLWHPPRARPAPPARRTSASRSPGHPSPGRVPVDQIDRLVSAFVASATFTEHRGKQGAPRIATRDHLSDHRPDYDVWNDQLLTPLGVGPVVRVDTDHAVVDGVVDEVRASISDLPGDERITPE